MGNLSQENSGKRKFLLVMIRQDITLNKNALNILRVKASPTLTAEAKMTLILKQLAIRFSLQK
jgi:hypothetical protein